MALLQKWNHDNAEAEETPRFVKLFHILITFPLSDELKTEVSWENIDIVKLLVNQLRILVNDFII